MYRDSLIRKAIFFSFGFLLSLSSGVVKALIYKPPQKDGVEKSYKISSFTFVFGLPLIIISICFLWIITSLIKCIIIATEYRADIGSLFFKVIPDSLMLAIWKMANKAMSETGKTENDIDIIYNVVFSPSKKNPLLEVFNAHPGFDNRICKLTKLAKICGFSRKIKGLTKKDMREAKRSVKKSMTDNNKMETNKKDIS